MNNGTRMSNEQWRELSPEVTARVTAEYNRLQAARAAQRELMQRLPCLLAPVVAP